MLADQLFAYKLLGETIFIQGVDINISNTELLSCNLNEVSTLDEFVLDQISNKRQLIAGGLLLSLEGCLIIQELRQHHLFG